MKLIRRCPLRNIKHNHLSRMKALFASMFCSAQGKNSMELDPATPQTLLGYWWNSGASTSFTTENVAYTFCENLGMIRNRKTMHGAVAVYGIYPDEGKGFAIAPALLAKAFLDFLEVPNTQPTFIFWHRQGLTSHLHVAVNRYDSVKNGLLQEGKGWARREGATFLQCREKVLGEDDFHKSLQSAARILPLLSTSGGLTWTQFHRAMAESNLAYIPDVQATGGARLIMWGASLPAVQSSSQLALKRCEELLMGAFEQQPVTGHIHI